SVWVWLSKFWAWFRGMGWIGKPNPNQTNPTQTKQTNPTQPKPNQTRPTTSHPCTSHIHIQRLTHLRLPLSQHPANSICCFLCGCLCVLHMVSVRVHIVVDVWFFDLLVEFRLCLRAVKRKHIQVRLEGQSDHVAGECVAQTKVFFRFH